MKYVDFATSKRRYFEVGENQGAPALLEEQDSRSLRGSSPARGTMEACSEAQLWRAWRAGSEAAFADLVERYQGLVYSTCMRILQDPHLAEDATQAAFLALFQRGSALPEGTNVAGWLHVVAQACALNCRRSQGRRARHEKAAARITHNERGCSAPHESWASISLHLDSALASLPSPQREALTLRFLCGRSEAAAAAEMGCPVRTLHTRVTTGLAKLRQKLQRQDAYVSASFLSCLLDRHAAEATPADLAARLEATCVGKAAASPLAQALAQEIGKTLVKSSGIQWVWIGSSILALGVVGAARMTWKTVPIAPPPPKPIQATDSKVEPGTGVLGRGLHGRGQSGDRTVALKFVIEDLGTLGGPNTIAFAINRQGDVVGTSNSHACLWKGGQTLDLNPPGAETSAAVGVDESGRVIVHALFKVSGQAVTRSFCWRNGTHTQIGPLTTNWIAAHSVNGAGLVVGTESTFPFTGVASSFPVTWKDGQYTKLPFQGSFMSINNLGQVVGSVGLASGKPHAALWENDRLTDLQPLLPGGVEASVARRINAHGLIWIQGSLVSDPPGFTHHFFIQNGSSLGESFSTQTYFAGIGDMNNLGEVVFYDKTPGGGSQACLFRNGTRSRLQDLVESASWHAGGWTRLSLPFGINDATQIVGEGWMGATARMFRLTPVKISPKSE